jgi:hypothetical protein
MSRRKFVALAGGSAAAAALLGACGGGEEGGETDQFGDGDVGILNYVLTIEYLESALYAAAAGSGLFQGVELKTIQEFGGDEAQHVSALTKAVERAGGEPATEPKTEFPLKNARSVLELAGTIENLGAAAYLGQIPRIESPAALATVLSIHSIEGKHAAAIDTLSGKSPWPDGAFAKPATARAVLRSVEPFIAV